MTKLVINNPNAPDWATHKTDCGIHFNPLTHHYKPNNTNELCKDCTNTLQAMRQRGWRVHGE